MPSVSVPNTFSNNTNADATQVNANFSALVNWINTYAIQPDSAVFTVFPTLPNANPTTNLHAVNKQYVDNFLPAGMIAPFGGSAAPSGWRLCDGAAYDGNDPVYARLWNAIGTSFGGTGIAAFNVPDLRGRAPIGAGTGTGLTNRVLGTSGGAETHVLTVAELAGHAHTGPSHQHGLGNHVHSIAHDHPSFTSATDSHNHTADMAGTVTSGHTHLGNGGQYLAGQIPSSVYDSGTQSNVINSDTHSHTIDVPNFTGNSGVPVNNLSDAGGTGNTGTSGSGNAHNNMQPWSAVNYIIKL